MSLCLYYCSTCLSDQGMDAQTVQADLEARMPEGCAVEAAPCMNMCGKPVSIAWRDAGNWAYLFSGVDPMAQAQELAAFARAYLASDAGDITDARACGELRFQLVGRLPPQASRAQK